MSFRTTFALALVAVCSSLAAAQSSLPPSWTYSSYFGGSAADGISAQTADSNGNIYVTGATSSSDFPTTPGVYEPAFPGSSRDNVIFVSKFSPEGKLIWSTYLGPGCYTYIVPSGIAVDAGQNVYIGGIFECAGFPATPPLPNNGSVFLAKLNSTGSQLVYSAVLGGNSVLGDPSVAVDSHGNAFLTGAGDYCCNTNTGNIGPGGGISDFWVAEINHTGNGLPWSVMIGGSDMDLPYGMVIDSNDKLYLTGQTFSADFPTSPGSLILGKNGWAFAMKLDPAKKPSSSIVYSALVGDSGNDSNPYIQGNAIAVDRSGNAYVATYTYNTRMFTGPHAFQRSASTGPDAYVFELNAAGSALLNGTYVAGAAFDDATAISVDNSGNTYVSGFTQSWDFPTTAYGPVLDPFNYTTAFYVKLNPQFAAVSSVQYASAQGTESWTGNADLAGGLWISGFAGAQFPTTPNAYQQNYAGNYDAYLVHTNFLGLCAPTTVSICTLAEDANNSERIHFAAQSADVEGATLISLALDGQIAYEIPAAQFDTWLPVAPGNHTATVTARGVNSNVETTQQSFNVPASHSCPLNPISPSLTICNPLNAAVIDGPVNIHIVANESVPPKTVSLSVDSKFVAVLFNQNGNYRYSMTLPAGPHTMTVRGTDSNHGKLRTSAVFKVVD